MTDDSKFALRWEIDNATERFATGKVESEVFDQGGFRWTVAAERRDYDIPKLTLRCDAGHKQHWKCEADVHFYLRLASGGGDKASPNSERFIFTESSCSLVRVCDTWKWHFITIPRYITNGAVMFEVRINIITSENGELFADPSEFAAPNRMSNVILKIGDKKLHVYKELLAVHSPVFAAMFFRDFAEKGKEEVELKDVVYEEFLDLLHFIYLSRTVITDRSVLHMLKLADRFQIERILEQAKAHLIQSEKIDIMKKLLVADQYNLADLKDHLLELFANVTELHKKLQTSPESAKFTSDIKAAIYDRMVKLKLQ